MKKQTNSTIKAYLLRGACYLLLLLAVCAISLALAQQSSIVTGKASHPTAAGLTFANRVAYQTAIEDVYWRHRIWPNTNPGPKPELDKVMSQADIEKKVAEYLRNSQALEDYWQKPITADQLQAEMERMARDTKQPEVLQELFEALGNDPFVIAECLARPILTERLTADLAVVAGVPPAPRKSFAADTAASTENRNRVTPNVAYTLPVIGNPSGSCIDNWVSTTLTNAPSARGRHTAVWTGTEMIVWGGNIGGSYFNTGGKYNPSTDSWTATSTTNAPSGRFLHTAVWTGSEMIVWGGSHGSYFNTGGRYNPSTDTWTATTTIGAPDARDTHTTVWTGSEMIVWGGSNGSSYFNTGGRYNPSSNSWTTTSTTNAPAARNFVNWQESVWTGSEMIVWGGWDGSTTFNTGGRYDPSTDSWTATSTTGAPEARQLHTTVWTGSETHEMMIWGGDGGNFCCYLNTGGRYDPTTDGWTVTSTINAPTPRRGAKAVWTGTEMIVWGGFDGGGVGTGGRYDPTTDSWTTTSLVNAPSGRFYHSVVWTGSEMIVWGGGDSTGATFNNGGRYCVAAPSPTPTATATATPTATATATATPTPTVSSTPRPTPMPRSRPTPAPRP